MEKIHSAIELKNAILQLEEEKRKKQLALEIQFENTYQSLSPVNLVKTAFSGLTKSTLIRSVLINAAIGLGAGVISKKIIVGHSTNLARKILGTGLEFAIAGIFGKNAEKIKSKIGSIFTKQNEPAGASKISSGKLI